MPGHLAAKLQLIESGQTKFDIQRMQQIASVLEVDPVFLMNFNDNMVFYNNSEYNHGWNIVNHYHTLAETERTTLLNRIQQLEKLVEELVQQKK